MWYFAWVLGIGFAVLLAILNTLWGEHEEARAQIGRTPTDAETEEARHGHEPRAS